MQRNGHLTALPRRIPHFVLLSFQASILHPFKIGVLNASCLIEHLESEKRLTRPSCKLERLCYERNCLF